MKDQHHHSILLHLGRGHNGPHPNTLFHTQYAHRRHIAHHRWQLQAPHGHQNPCKVPFAQQHHHRSLSIENLPEELPDLQPAEGDQIHREVAAWLVPMIQLLSEPYREAVRLAEIIGLPHKEVAQRQNISLSAAKSRVLRGKVMLKKLITDCCQLEFDQRGRVVDYERKVNCSC